MQIVGRLDDGNFVATITPLERSRLEEPQEKCSLFDTIKNYLFVENPDVFWNVWDSLTNPWALEVVIACRTYKKPYRGACLIVSLELLENDTSKLIKLVAKEMGKLMKPIEEGVSWEMHQLRPTLKREFDDVTLKDIRDYSGNVVREYGFVPVGGGLTRRIRAEA